MHNSGSIEPIVLVTDDDTGETKAKACHRQLQAAWESMR